LRKKRRGRKRGRRRSDRSSANFPSFLSPRRRKKEGSLRRKKKKREEIVTAFRLPLPVLLPCPTPDSGRKKRKRKKGGENLLGRRKKKRGGKKAAHRPRAEAPATKRGLIVEREGRSVSKEGRGKGSGEDYPTLPIPYSTVRKKGGGGGV